MLLGDEHAHRLAVAIADAAPELGAADDDRRAVAGRLCVRGGQSAGDRQGGTDEADGRDAGFRAEVGMRFFHVGVVGLPAHLIESLRGAA